MLYRLNISVAFLKARTNLYVYYFNSASLKFIGLLLFVFQFTLTFSSKWILRYHFQALLYRLFRLYGFLMRMLKYVWFSQFRCFFWILILLKKMLQKLMFIINTIQITILFIDFDALTWCLYFFERNHYYSNLALWWEQSSRVILNNWFFRKYKCFAF